MRKDTEIDKLMDRLNCLMTNWAIGQCEDKSFTRAMTSVLLELQTKLAEMGIVRDWLKE